LSYRSTIARQPAQLAESLPIITDNLEKVELQPFSRGGLAITGIGASYEAACVSAAELQRRGRRAFAWHAVDLPVAENPADSMIALSAGGRSVEPVAALQKHATIPSLAVTSSGSNPLSTVAKAALAFHSGEDATPSSTGYTITLLAMGLLSEKICPRSTGYDWSDIVRQAGEVLDQSAASMAHIGEIFKDRRAIDCVGANSALGTAGEAGLLIREAARIPTATFDTLHYLHGPMEPMDGRSGVIIFGDGREIKLAQDMQATGCGVLLVTSDRQIVAKDNLAVIYVPECANAIARAIVDILPAQLLAAQLSDAVGLTDTKFRYPQTDTKIGEDRPAS